MNVNSVAFNFITLNCAQEPHQGFVELFKSITFMKVFSHLSTTYRCNADTVLVFPSSVFVFVEFNWKVFANDSKTVTCALAYTQERKRENRLYDLNVNKKTTNPYVQ